PDENEPSLLSSFEVAQSGSPVGVGPGTTLPPPPPKRVPKACPYGIGGKQFDSVYAPDCATVFVGDNGGATDRGVTKDTVNICITAPSAWETTDGEISPEPGPGDDDKTRTYKALLNYFNSRMQFYGRQIRMFYVADDAQGGTDTAALARARTDKAVDKYGCWGGFILSDPDEIDEAYRRKYPNFTLAQQEERFYDKYNPYVWTFSPSGDQMVRMGVEYACKKLAGRPPIYTPEDPSNGITHDKPRKFGVLAYSGVGYDTFGDMAVRMLKEQCGVDATIVKYDYTQSNGQALASAMTQMKIAKVTTIFDLAEKIGLAAITPAATSNNYFPEWFNPGFGGTDMGHLARDLFDHQQWVHAFGFSFFEIPKTDDDSECYRAYHAVYPNSNPNDDMCIYLWSNFIQLFRGIQDAGPKLTVETFRDALLSQPARPPDPQWFMAGGYSVHDHGYPDYAAEWWWSPDAIASDGSAGSNVYLRNGKRVTFGQWNPEDNGLFHLENTMVLAP
ncbi:MAG: hypothetical protein V7636_2631, partial [Actinomycetota bacterium]